jgi:hypothetical protein
MPPPSPPHASSKTSLPEKQAHSPSCPLFLRRQSQHSQLAKSLFLHQNNNSDPSEKLATTNLPLPNSNVVPNIRVDLASPDKSASSNRMSTTLLPNHKIAVSSKAMPLNKFKGVGPAASDTPEPSAPASPRM